MKKFYRNLLLIYLLLFCINLSAQRNKKPQNLPKYDFKKIHFGFTIGINELDFDIKKNINTLINDTLLSIEGKSQKGFNLGIVSNFRIGKYSDLRFIPTLVFGERQLNYIYKDSVGANSIGEETKRIESTLIDFPIYIKYKSARYNNFRTYVLAGLKYSLDVASKDKVNDRKNELVKLKENDLLAEIGFGLDFYLEYFKFSPQIKIAYGILNIVTDNENKYNDPISRLNTNGWMLSFTFE